MISTIDTRNGFRFELIPMALASSSLASLALRNAMLAVAVFHRAGATAALPFKAKAVRYLSSSLSSEGNSGPATVNTQLAASMMLCVYSVINIHNIHIKRVLMMDRSSTKQRGIGTPI